MNKMNSSSPHFVRCVKPNTRKAASVFECDHVKAQLHYTGVMETVRIRKEGYALRISFQDFLERYAEEKKPIFWVGRKSRPLLEWFESET